MNVGILVVTHEQIGAQLIEVASTIFKPSDSTVSLVSVPADLKPETLGQYADLIRDAIRDQDQGQGVLVLTDVFGATPDNLSRYFSENCEAMVISGINLPMLLRVLNYAHQTLEQLGEIAMNGGRSGIRTGQQ